MGGAAALISQAGQYQFPMPPTVDLAHASHFSDFVVRRLGQKRHLWFRAFWPLAHRCKWVRGAPSQCCGEGYHHWWNLCEFPWHLQWFGHEECALADLGWLCVRFFKDCGHFPVFLCRSLAGTRYEQVIRVPVVLYTMISSSGFRFSWFGQKLHFWRLISPLTPSEIPKPSFFDWFWAKAWWMPRFLRNLVWLVTEIWDEKVVSESSQSSRCTWKCVAPGWLSVAAVAIVTQ